MEKKNLDDFRQDVISIFKRYEETGTIPWTYKIAAHDLSYQIGSLTKAIMQLEGERHAEGKTREEVLKKVADELADIFAEVLFIAHELDISLEEAWEGMLRSDQTKIEARKTS
jgi:NTP pyrophosphatase (non-canonical NTP hydrolase)